MSKYRPYIGYDIIGDYNWNHLLNCPIIFICVPTPSGKDGHLDCNVVESNLEKLNKDRYKGIVVIKSTLRAGFMDAASKRYPELKIVYMPEFLRENNSFTWSENPDRIVISGNNEDIDTVLRYFDWIKDIPILKMNNIDAELGKLAHNAYIATKVSFTNTIELTSKACNADPINVMSVIWADRRVKDRSHLVPGLGGYSGKCIPKDTSELNTFSKSIHVESTLFDAVESVNELVLPSKTGIDAQVNVIIPTNQQDNLIQRALESVSKQSYLPRIVLVVYDSSKGLSQRLKDIIDSYRDKLNIHLIENTGTNNLAGAINFGLNYLKNKCNIPDSDFIALLDDDDYWNYRYLQNCLSFSIDVDCEWVISGLIRYDEKTPSGIHQNIPDEITIHDFLVGNPNVQGSNMFIRFDKIYSISGMDEDLTTTTDRDLCIRLLQIKDIRIGYLRNHLVHHDCLSRSDRLSVKGSPKKINGLCVFFQKYCKTMTEEEKAEFIQRGEKYFGLKLEFLNKTCRRI